MKRIFLTEEEKDDLSKKHEDIETLSLHKSCQELTPYMCGRAPSCLFENSRGLVL
jgi:hypothetical protein